MPRMCCVTGCSSNYRGKDRSEDYISMYKLPTNVEERERWLQNIPRENIPKGKDTAVCQKHWPESAKKVKVPGGRYRHLDPPTVFHGVAPSQIPTQAPLPRPTKRATTDIRTLEPDQSKKHKKSVTVYHSEISTKIHSEIQPRKVVTYSINDVIHLQSEDFISGVPKYIVKINNDLTYETFYAGVRCYITTLTSPPLRVTKLTDWGHIIECIRYLDTHQPSHKTNVMLDNIESMSRIQKVGQTVYSMATMMRSFEYFATSRASYKKLLWNFQLPGITTLTKLTSKACALPDLDFVNKILNSLPEKQKECIILVDEVHVKPCLLYHGGKLFGKALNNPDELANSVLAVMVVCMYGGPNSLAKMIPVKKVSAHFRFKIIKSIATAITSTSGKIIAIINDNNRINQNFMSMFPIDRDKPWVTVQGDDIPSKIFLLNDFVHLFKSIRNNWFTEPTQEITFHHPDEDSPLTARWLDLITLYNCDREKEKIIKSSTLTYTSVFPKPIERQNVAHMLKIFSDETVAALTVFNKDNISLVNGTIKFIDKWVEVWKILNVKQPYTDVKLRDPRRAVMRNDEDSNCRLQTLLKMADMVERMDFRNGK